MNETGRSQLHVLKGHLNVCTSTVVLCTDPLSHTSDTKIPENTEDDPEPEYAVDFQMGYSSVYLCISNIGAVMKIYLYELRSL